MAKHPRLFRRGGKWTFRARVPDDLQAAIGKPEVWKSLGDVSHAEAVKLARIESVKLDGLFAIKRGELRQTPLSELSDADPQHVARAYFHELETSAAPMPFNEYERAERGAQADEDAALLGQSVEDASLHQVAKSVARGARLPCLRFFRYPRSIRTTPPQSDRSLSGWLNERMRSRSPLNNFLTNVTVADALQNEVKR